jgi:4-hydroxymandelate oxidase
VYRDRGLTRELVQRAAAAGYTALCLTVDTPMAGLRERDARNHFRIPEHLTLANFGGLREIVHGGGEGSSLAAYINSQWDPSLTWADVEWLREVARLPIVIKGVLAPSDAREAVRHGAAAVIVSNHGGRQLDHSPAGATVLRSVVDSVADDLEVLVDGGIRRGTDVLVALALGARAVLVGRPVLWGLAIGGARGVADVLEHLRHEIDLARALAGCASVGDITPQLLLQP